MIISVDEEKAIEQTQLPFMIKTFHKLGIQGNPPLNKHYLPNKQTKNKQKMLQVTRSSPNKVRNKARMSRLTTPFQHQIGSPSNAIRQEKKIKGILIQKEKIKIKLCFQMTCLRRNTKELTTNLFSEISYYYKVIAYKDNIKKSITFPHTNNELEFNIKNIIPLH